MGWLGGEPNDGEALLLSVCVCMCACMCMRVGVGVGVRGRRGVACVSVLVCMYAFVQIRVVLHERLQPPRRCASGLHVLPLVCDRPFEPACALCISLRVCAHGAIVGCLCACMHSRARSVCAREWGRGVGGCWVRGRGWRGWPMHTRLWSGRMWVARAPVDSAATQPAQVATVV